MADEFNSITALEFLVDSRMAIIKEVIDNADDLESLMTQGVARTTANRLRDISVLETNIIEYQGK